jgi:hypothetical protein
VIDGGGRVITGSLNRITVGSGITLTLRNIVFKTLPFTVAAGGKLTLDSGAVVRGIVWTSQEDHDIALGAMAISVNGTLVMKAGSLVTDNNVAGIVLLEDDSVFTMEGGTISYNADGGVIMNGKRSKFTMSGGVISHNAGAWGGGVQVFGQNSVFTMKNGEISYNQAMAGGGVLLWMWWEPDSRTTLNMEGGVIKNNHALDVGGGVICMEETNFSMTGGEITGNTSVNDGGGVYIRWNVTFTGNPSIGSKVNGKGSIYSNTPNDKWAPWGTSG